MLRFIVNASVVTGMLFGTAAAFAFSTGPPLSRTGAPAIGGKPAEFLCTVCHNLNPPNLPNGKVEILDLPHAYTPGQTYPLRVRLSSTANQIYPGRKWGFQMTAVYQGGPDPGIVSGGLGAGTWLLPSAPETDQLIRSTYPTSSTHTFKTRVYVSHVSPSSRKGLPSPSVWSFAWVAPPVDSGTVIFVVAGNAANGDSAALGSDDHIYTGRDTVLSPSLAVDVPPLARERFVTALEPPFPNPMTWLCVDVSFTIARAGTVDLAIFDAQGRRVRGLMHGWHDAGPGASFWNGKRDDGSQAANGVYFVRLKAPGEPRAITRRLVLAR
ncbi:MAG: choice-of-anchor V domain-containing protein [Candidatus Eiseniibacteriota bacterium]